MICIKFLHKNVFQNILSSRNQKLESKSYTWLQLQFEKKLPGQSACLKIQGQHELTKLHRNYWNQWQFFGSETRATSYSSL